MSPTITTFTGKSVTPLDPKIQDIEIEDIAHALALKCRFTGHCRTFYSIAEHSVRVSYLTNSLEGLLHDAAEAYTADVASPLKKKLPSFKRIEKRLEEVISKKFGLIFPFPDNVKEADLILYVTETRDLMPYNSTKLILPLATKIKPWGWKKAEYMFLRRFEILSED